MKIENIRLAAELHAANAELAQNNANLERRVEEKTLEAGLNLHVLRAAQETLDHLPLAVAGIGDDGLIAVANQRALMWFGESGLALGEEAARCISSVLLNSGLDDVTDASRATAFDLGDGRRGRYWRYAMGDGSDARGLVLVVDMNQMQGN